MSSLQVSSSGLVWISRCARPGTENIRTIAVLVMESDNQSTKLRKSYTRALSSYKRLQNSKNVNKSTRYEHSRRNKSDNSEGPSDSSDSSFASRKYPLRDGEESTSHSLIGKPSMGKSFVKNCEGQSDDPPKSQSSRRSWWRDDWATEVRPLTGKLPSSDDAKARKPSIETLSKDQITTTFSEQPQLASHTQTHYIKGGLPCDPAPAQPFRLADFGDDALYTLVLLRHGESEWNHLNQYTGWCDVNLTDKGKSEARDAGRLLLENGIEIDHAFTSVLKRASFTTNMALNTSKQHWVPVTKTWRLNERHYGALQGYNKDEAYKELGLDQELVMEMRRSYDVAPPPMSDDHPHWHGNDRRYKHLSRDQLESSRGESLKDCAARIMPFYQKVVLPSLHAGNRCLIVSHANTIRTFIKNIDCISDEDIKGMSIPTGIPLLYRLDRNFQPVDPKVDLEFRYLVEPKGYTWATSRHYGFSGVYLGDLERLQEIQKKRDATNRNWQRIILRNVATALLESMCQTESVQNGITQVMETRQLWFHIRVKMEQKPEYRNMMLLQLTLDYLEELMSLRRQRYLTKAGFESILNKIHLDTEGKVVEPFEELGSASHKSARNEAIEQLVLDMDDEILDDEENAPMREHTS